MKNLVVISQVAGRMCAFNAHDVQSVIEVAAVTPVPTAPQHILGITALRSQTLTVIDCRRVLGFDPDQWEIDHRAVVAIADGFSYAFKVDAIEDITTTLTEPAEIPGGFGREWSRIATGLVETMAGPALLLDVARMINPRGDIGAAA